MKRVGRSLSFISLIFSAVLIFASCSAEGSSFGQYNAIYKNAEMSGLQIKAVLPQGVTISHGQEVEIEIEMIRNPRPYEVEYERTWGTGSWQIESLPSGYIYEVDIEIDGGVDYDGKAYFTIPASSSAMTIEVPLMREGYDDGSYNSLYESISKTELTIDLVAPANVTFAPTQIVDLSIEMYGQPRAFEIEQKAQYGNGSWNFKVPAGYMYEIEAEIEVGRVDYDALAYIEVSEDTNQDVTLQFIEENDGSVNNNPSWSTAEGAVLSVNAVPPTGITFTSSQMVEIDIEMQGVRNLYELDVYRTWGEGTWSFDLPSGYTYEVDVEVDDGLSEYQGRAMVTIPSGTAPQSIRLPLTLDNS